MWLCVCAARAGDLGWRAPAGVPGSNMGGHIVLTGEGTACTYCRQRQGHRGMGRGAEHTGAGGDRHCMRLGGRLPSNLQRVQGVSANSQFSPPPSTAACFTTHPLHSGFLHLGRVWRRFLHRTHTCFPPPPPLARACITLQVVPRTHWCCCQARILSHSPLRTHSAGHPSSSECEGGGGCDG